MSRLLDELDAMEASLDAPRVSAAAPGEASLREEAATDAAFLARHPAGAFMAQIEARRLQQMSFWARLNVWIQSPSGVGLGLTGAVAALALVLWPAPVTLTPQAPGVVAPAGGHRLKTAVDLAFYTRSGDTVQLGTPGGSYHPGDQIQLRYSTPNHRHLVVVSIDSAGAITPFYADGARSLRIDPGVAKVLDGAIELDGTLGPERIIGCFSAAPLDTSKVVGAARAALEAAGGAPDRVERLPLDCAQSTFLIHKAARGL